MNLQDLPNTNESVHAEQSVIGALLLDNDALYRITELESSHFYRGHHRAMFTEIGKQIAKGQRCDIFTLFDAIQHHVPDCLPYLNQISQNVPSSANIVRYAQIVIDRALKRALIALGKEMQEASREESEVLLDRFASKIDALAQKKTMQEPQRMDDMLGNYFDVIQARFEGRIQPISTGFADLDNSLNGGLERGTLTVVAARPGMGKTAFGLAIARNVSQWGTSLFLSMEMSRDQVNDRNIASLGKIPIAWLRKPDEDNSDYWNSLTYASKRAQELNLYIDDQTSLNMLDIRSKARTVKRKCGLDILVIDQLSFIKGGESDKQWEVVGEHTRNLMALAKELNIAVVLLCQLNRKCDDRPDKRPMMSDLALSGSIEQDAANIFFLYRDEIYDCATPDKGVCEVIIAKQRQGTLGRIALEYIAAQTRFDNLNGEWQLRSFREKVMVKGGFR